ncbi:hypothetical protein HN011_006376 [Eciton burchellii]|nr:hypothetical protein HN011_006376 [Eciton burchellii]
MERVVESDGTTLVHNFEALGSYMEKKRKKNRSKEKGNEKIDIKVIWFDMDTFVFTPISKDRIVLYTTATNLTIDLWMPIERRTRDGCSKKEGETN